MPEFVRFAVKPLETGPRPGISARPMRGCAGETGAGRQARLSRHGRRGMTLFALETKPANRL
ncbi:MAG: hypothetical protein ACFB6R_02385 [Alphaproteobacteria bacterium]